MTSVNSATPATGLPITEGWALVIGLSGMFLASGTRFGGVIAGIGGIAVLYQLGAWAVTVGGSAPGPASTPTPTTPAYNLT